MLLYIKNAKVVLEDTILLNGCILVEDGIIKAIGSETEIPLPPEACVYDANGLYVGPGFVDIHCHGYADPENPRCGVRARVDPVAVARGHLRHGTTSITPSSTVEWTVEDYQRVAPLYKADMEAGGNIIGMHFEGPFLSKKYGASRESSWEFSRERCDVIFDAAGSALLHCTYAPEIDGAPEFEAYLAERGVIADIGHTEMSLNDVERAVRAGARIVTHLFDAMGCSTLDSQVSTGTFPQETAADAALATEGLYYELICDSLAIHVKPSNMRVALRTAGEDQIILITDCTGAAKCEQPENGAKDLNFNEMGRLSGSRLTMDQAAANFKKYTGADIRVVFKCAATNPAKALRLDHRVGAIKPGLAANFVVVNETMQVHAVFFKGNEVQDVYRPNH